MDTNGDLVVFCFGDKDPPDILRLWAKHDATSHLSQHLKL